MNAWVAWNETPTIVCAAGETEAKALKKMAKKLEKIMTDREYIISISFSYHDSESVVTVVLGSDI